MQLVQTGAPALTSALILAVPVSYFIVSLVAGSASVVAIWRRARIGAGVALAAALGCALLQLVSAEYTASLAGMSLGRFGQLTLSLRMDAAGALMLPLVCFVGWIIVRFSPTYLDGQPGQQGYVRALAGTLTSVSMVVVTDNLLVLAIAWTGTSLALHRLLTFYDERPEALISAHKKFIASRLADLCLFAAFALIGWQLHTLEIAQVLVRLAALDHWPAMLQVAAVLVALTAILRCAQLPVHGWLIQVMEAPTPVSALLHAGVVNLGGFVLVRLAGLVAPVPAAQVLLVVVGSTTAVLAGLVMTTRISIKVKLAWSTCAQMGFMLMECGLGLYQLAMLHLLAHSFYKAYCFLSSGEAVAETRRQSLAPIPTPPHLRHWVAALIATVPAVAAGVWLWGVRAGEVPALAAVGLIVALALAPIVSPCTSQTGRLRAMAAFGAALAVSVVYFGLHRLLGRWIAARPMPGLGEVLLAGWVCLSFSVLFVLQAVIAAHPDGRWSQRLYPWFYSGFYVDEIFTRLTFRLWPARLPETAAHPAIDSLMALTAGAE